jgi:hypothetical protein
VWPLIGVFHYFFSMKKSEFEEFGLFLGPFPYHETLSFGSAATANPKRAD